MPYAYLYQFNLILAWTSVKVEHESMLKYNCVKINWEEREPCLLPDFQFQHRLYRRCAEAVPSNDLLRYFLLLQAEALKSEYKKQRKALTNGYQASRAEMVRYGESALLRRKEIFLILRPLDAAIVTDDEVT